MCQLSGLTSLKDKSDEALNGGSQLTLSCKNLQGSLM